MSLARCGQCGTLFNGERHVRCYVCGAPPMARPVSPAKAPAAMSSPAEEVLARDHRTSIVGSAIIAIIGAVGVWNGALYLGVHGGMHLILGVALLVAICIGATHLCSKEGITHNEAGLVTLKVFHFLGVIVLVLVGIGAALFILLLIVCSGPIR